MFYITLGLDEADVIIQKRAKDQEGGLLAAFGLHITWDEAAAFCEEDITEFNF